jgi:pimeloyl-ACP methyl ester carboxylesterase
MARPRLVLVCEFTELQWAIKPLLEEWADVVSWDLPGVGDEPMPADPELTPQAAVRHGLAKIDESGWERYFVVADGWGIGTAIGIAAERPAQVAGVALGHASLSFRHSGDRAPMNAEVYDAFTQLVKQDAPSFIRYGISQLTKGAVDEELALQILERVPPDLLVRGWLALTSERDFEAQLRALECPLFLAKHEGCLMSTDEGFEDAVAALPGAEVASFDGPPAASAEFAARLRRFCERLADDRE